MRQLRLLISTGLVVIIGGLVAGCAASTPPPSAAPLMTVPNQVGTATAAPTDTATPQISEVHMDVPAWVADPDASVVMFKATHTGEGASAETISMLDAVSGQHFDLPMVAPSTYFWMPDGKGFGYVDSEVHTVDSATGVISHSARTSLTQKFVESGSTWPGMASGAIPTSPDFFIFPAPNNYGRPELSENLRFAAIYSDNDLILENLQTEQQVSVPRDDSIEEINSQWLPGGSILALLRRTSESNTADNAGKLQLDFFDVDSGEVLASYPDIVMSGRSPDGEMALYTAGGPCILKWRTGEHWCLDDGRGIHHANQTYRFAWSPDGTMISFAYWAGSGKHGVGGICVKHLDSGDMVCPMLGHPDFADGVVQNYMWSSDSRYFFFNYAIGSCPGCDFEESSYLGMISINGNIVHYPIDDLYAYPTDTAIWRPLIVSN